MMRGFRSLGLLMVPALGAAFMTGCTPPPVKESTPAPVIVPASPDQITNVTIDVLKFDPNAKIGHVADVQPANSSAAVIGIPLTEVKPGETTIIFTDAHQTPIANGTVSYTFKPGKDIAVETIVVDYVPTATGRAPVKGDLAILLKDKAQ